MGLQKVCKFFCIKLGVMRGFQKGITLGGRTPGSGPNAGLQNMVAKKFAKFLHLNQDPSWGS